MDKKKLMRYKANNKELVLLETSLDKLYEQLEEVQIIAGKVSKSSDDFPYTEQHITVKMKNPNVDQSGTIHLSWKKKIRDKEDRQKFLFSEQAVVEKYINEIPDGLIRQIFESVYIDGMSIQNVGETVGYTKGRVSQIISNFLED